MKYLLISILLFSCNPVKQVLRDKEKLDKVAEYVVENGYCANDTIIQSKSDTLITYDTIYEKGLDIVTNIHKIDTLRIPLTKTLVKTIRITDTIQRVVVDNARIRLLEAKLDAQIKRVGEFKNKAQSRLMWLILLLMAFLLRLLYKPIKKFILWHYSPMLK
ncbi:MAG: hypothetical protein FJY17_00725 [Bacteroidetes bacterium]|nr:hypothetical protein [Bacteroidota bacterium]